MAMPPVPANLAAALRFGPQTQSTMRRSQYLSDALKQIQSSGGQNIQSGGELATKLLATAILQRGSEKADKSALTALKTDQDAETAALVGALRPKPATPTIAAPAPPTPVQPAPQAQIPQQQPVALPSAQPTPPPVSQLALNPEVDKLVRTVWGEARGEDPLGQLGVANVVINRAKKGGKSINDVVLEKSQFEPWSNPESRAKLEALTPDSPDYQRILANIAPALQGQDVTGGADHFYSPSAQSAAGRPPPKWDNGSGVDHGRHRFFSLGYGGQGAHQREQTPAVPFEQPQTQAPPFQVATNGQIDPAMLQASAPAGPNGGGAAPAAAIPPQAAAAGANVEWPTWKPNQQQVDYVEGLLRDPRTHDQGVSEARKLQAKMAEPEEAQIIQQNGVSFYVSKTPGGNGQPVMVPIPQQAMTQVQTAQEAGLPTAPQGAYVQRDPFGNLREAPFAPPAGYNAGPSGYAPIQGGPADPTRLQAPASGYQYQGGVQAPIQGGPADPRNPTNLIEGTKGIRSEIAPIVQQAVNLQRNINAVRAGMAQQSGSGDVAGVTGLQKLIDEGVVQSGEMDNQLKAQGLMGGIAGIVGYMGSDGKFSPEIRRKIQSVAENIYAANNSSLKNRVMGYKPIAANAFGDDAFDKYVLTPDMVSQLGWSANPQGAPPPAPNAAVVAPTGPAGSREAAIAEARRRGLIK